MTYKEILNQLEGLGTEHNRNHQIRYGSGSNTFGVSLTMLKKLAKDIGPDHDLALALWASENIDARMLSTMIMDPNRILLKEVEKWLKSIKYFLLNRQLARLIAKSQLAHRAIQKWTVSKDEQIQSCGFNILNYGLKNGISIDISLLKDKLLQIKSTIHKSSNQVQNTMNAALMAIGRNCPELNKEAMKVAKSLSQA